jgi:hypothetical protein
VDQEQQRKRGRPPKAEDEVKRHPIGVRTTKALKEKIEDAAAGSGRSVAQEVEARLEQSFRPVERHIALPLDMMSAMIRIAEERTGQRWNDDITTWVAVKQSIMMLIDSNRPPTPNAPAMDAAYARMEKASAQLGDNPLAVFQLPPEERAGKIAEHSAALDELKEATKLAVEMGLVGREIAADIGDHFRLRPRGDGNGA